MIKATLCSPLNMSTTTMQQYMEKIKILIYENNSDDGMAAWAERKSLETVRGNWDLYCKVHFLILKV